MQCGLRCCRDERPADAIAMVIDLDRVRWCFANHRDPWIGALGIDCDGIVVCNLWPVEETHFDTAVDWSVDGKCNLSATRSVLLAFLKAFGNRIDGAIGSIH